MKKRKRAAGLIAAGILCLSGCGTVQERHEEALFVLDRKESDCYNLIFDTCEERKVPQPLENTGLWHFSPWNRYMVMFYLRLLFFSISFIFRFVIN